MLIEGHGGLGEGQEAWLPASLSQRPPPSSCVNIWASHFVGAGTITWSFAS